MNTLEELQAENEELHNALAKMFLWQASQVNELLPEDLGDEVRALLGNEMVDAIIDSHKHATFEDIQMQLAKNVLAAMEDLPK